MHMLLIMVLVALKEVMVLVVRDRALNDNSYGTFLYAFIAIYYWAISFAPIGIDSMKENLPYLSNSIIDIQKRLANMDSFLHIRIQAVGELT